MDLGTVTSDSHPSNGRYVVAQSVAEKDFMQKPKTALFYNNKAKLAWSRDGSDRSVLFVHE